MGQEVRADLIDRLFCDLIGPGSAEEETSDLPSDRYLSGILFPRESSVGPEEDDGDGGVESDGKEASEGESAGMFLASRPASAGLSFSIELDADSLDAMLEVSISCGMYARAGEDSGEGASAQQPWRRAQRKAERELPLDPRACMVSLSDQIPGMELFVKVVGAGRNRMVTLAAVNQNRATKSKPDDEALTYFQFCMRVSCRPGARFVPRPSRRIATDEDGRIAALIYRHAREYAVGHTCSAHWEEMEPGSVGFVETSWLPVATVHAMSAAGDACFAPLRSDPKTNPLSASWLAEAGDADLADGLERLVSAYGRWIEGQEGLIGSLDQALQPQANANVAACRLGQARMQDAVALLRSKAEARMAFRLAQKAIVIQRRWSRGEPDLVWRPFQLGFQLLALRSLWDPKHKDRGVMDLLWFPTGGGKTEAYLALTAFTFFMRRLQEGNQDEGQGVAVLMRYTLRLLTIQQFQRAAAMVLACEYLRRGRERPGTTAAARLGSVPFSIGLWVGGGATPNRFEQARTALNGGVEVTSTPRQLLECPCCKKQLIWTAVASTRKVLVACENGLCDLGRSGKHLPVWTVDEDLYRERPSLVIATVDKFAQIARRLETGALFGLDRPGTRPPDLIIQDELHLISGPLGTITGLYEVAIDFLCARDGTRSKIIGSTATIRRAAEQIRGLFDRDTFQFPPPCIDASNSGFAVEDRAAPGRRYVGITTVGRSPKFTLQASCAALLQAVGGSGRTKKDLDPYWTLVAYFNSLRELGGAVVLMLDDVPASLRQYARRHGEAKRSIEEPVELTSRVSSKEIPDILAQLQIPADKPGAVDVLLASNMISVGVDIPRLGLMVVNGQPKTIAEYIQATSRVGREYPGLVVALYNHARVRDRSHFESFPNWHATLYREVEATSVTPFASRARDKALPAVLVAMARHLVAGMATSVTLTPEARVRMEPVVAEIRRRAAGIQPDEVEGTNEKLRALLDEWGIRQDLEEYWEDDGRTGTLLMSAEQHAAFGAEGIRMRAWPAPNSVREVEPGTPYRLKERISEQGS